MPKPNPQDIQDELNQINKTTYGDEEVSGHMPAPESDDNTKDLLTEVIGNEPAHDSNIADEVNKDEKAILDQPIDDYQTKDSNTESLPTEESAEGTLAGVSQNMASSTQDPFEALTDKDIK